MAKQPSKMDKVKRTADKVDKAVDKVLGATDWLGRK